VRVHEARLNAQQNSELARINEPEGRPMFALQQLDRTAGYRLYILWA
jgi:hypothetical protein